MNIKLSSTSKKKGKKSLLPTLLVQFHHLWAQHQKSFLLLHLEILNFYVKSTE